MIVKNFNQKFLIDLLLFLSIFLCDRISKIYVIHLNNKFFGSEIFSSKYLNIYLIWNEGIAFGLFSFSEKNLYNFLTIIILLVIIAVLFLLVQSKGFKRFAFLMIFGGAVGNFYDRVVFKGVPDFIDFHIGNFHWFIFNVADIFITLGVIFVILFELIDNNKQVHEKK
tara:strand:- start:8432 stop:8935 length:504 start_codon:yes stop_codon:yes gene_type:complete